MESHITINRKWFKKLITPIIELSNLAISQLNCHKCTNYNANKKMEIMNSIRKNPYLKALSELHMDITQFKELKCSWFYGRCNITSFDDICLFIDMFKFYTGSINIENLNEIKNSLEIGGVDENQLSFFEEYKILDLKTDEKSLNELSLLIDKISLSYKPKEIIQRNYIPRATEEKENHEGAFSMETSAKHLEYEKILLERKEHLNRQNQQKQEEHEEHEEQEEVLGGNKKKIIKKLRKYIS
jgi:hypothetical protein